MKKPHCNCKFFSFIEMIVIIAIIGILIGILLPALTKLRERSKYLRWQAYHITVNLDPDAVVNYNFEFTDFSVFNDGAVVPALYNGACGSTRAEGDQYAYHGIINGSPEWGHGGGRWGFKNCIQFDGHNDCVTLPNSNLLNFNPGNDDFTFMTWVSFYNTGIQYLFSKAKNIKQSQYNLHYNGTNIGAGAGGTLNQWKVDIKADRWYHMAMVSESGNPTKLYIDGELVTTTVGSVGIPEEAIYDSKFVLGALGGENNNPRQFFAGKMDEFMVFSRALQPSEIRYHYQMGNPY